MPSSLLRQGPKWSRCMLRQMHICIEHWLRFTQPGRILLLLVPLFLARPIPKPPYADCAKQPCNGFRDFETRSILVSSFGGFRYAFSLQCSFCNLRRPYSSFCL